MKKYKFLYLSLIAILSLNSCIREDNTPVEITYIEDVISPNVGGPTQPNQVWVDLNTGEQTTNRRDAWELAFTNDTHFRVMLNYSIMMAVGKIPNAYDIDAVTERSVAQLKNKVQVANFQQNDMYVDNPAGVYATQTTGIDAISINDNENAVYLLNLGREINTGSVAVGSAVPSNGVERGWMKIRILRHDDGYKLQYAKLSENTHKEIIIKKNSDYNFQFFSFTNESEVLIQPKKDKWHFVHTVMLNTIYTGSFFTTYNFSDMVLTNIHGKVKTYMVTVPKGENVDKYFNNFDKNNIDESLLKNDDQRAIGSKWRGVAEGSSQASIFPNRFFIIKDSNNNYFKVRFLRMKNTLGERGYPEFEYKLI